MAFPDPSTQVADQMTAAEMNCRELVALVTDYLEDTLSPGDRRRFDAHLHECPYCVRYVDQMRRTIRLMGELSVENVPAPALEALLDVFRDWRMGSL